MVLRGVLSPAWVVRLRALVDVMAHPNVWDVLYSRLVANFYCAQKSILVHHVGVRPRGGRGGADDGARRRAAAHELAARRRADGRAGQFAAHELVCRRLRGHGYHRRRVHAGGARRPAAPLSCGCGCRSPTLGRSTSTSPPSTTAPSRARAQRRHRPQRHKLRTPRRARRVGPRGRAGAVGGRARRAPRRRLAFAATTPHVAEARDCAAPAAGACLRLILSFAGDNARYAGGRAAGLIPRQPDHRRGAARRPFPTVWPEMAADEWAAPFRPGARTAAAAIADAVAPARALRRRGRRDGGALRRPRRRLRRALGQRVGRRRRTPCQPGALRGALARWAVR